jgi:hypothetical protein
MCNFWHSQRRVDANLIKTFGCTHYQQLVWELFDHIISDWDASGDTDQSFLTSVKQAYTTIDRGVHIGSWGQIQGILSYHYIHSRANGMYHRMEDRS